jgi:DHA2 family multidrug resistance protein-like MFS transporter
VAVRALQALGAAAALSVSPALVRSIYPASWLGRGLSFNTAAAAASATLAPTLGGSLLSIARWPWLFAAVVPFGVLSILMGRRTLPEPRPHQAAYDGRGAAMCAGMFGLSVSGLEMLAQGGSTSLAAVLLTFGIGLGAAFVRRELRQKRPVLPVDLLRYRSIALSTIAGVAANMGNATLVLTLPFRLQQAYHFTPVEVGGVLAAWPLVVMFTAPTAGALSDRLPAGLLGALGMTVAIAGLFSLTLLPAAPAHLDLAWRIALCGLGFGMFFAPNARQVVACAPLHRAAAAGALVSTTRGVGQTLGATAVAAIFASGLGTGAAAPLIAAGFALLAGLTSALVLSSPPRLQKD